MSIVKKGHRPISGVLPSGKLLVVQTVDGVTQAALVTRRGNRFTAALFRGDREQVERELRIADDERSRLSCR